jgi:hypothetical protein
MGSSEGLTFYSWARCQRTTAGKALDPLPPGFFSDTSWQISLAVKWNKCCLYRPSFSWNCPCPPSHPCYFDSIVRSWLHLPILPWLPGHMSLAQRLACDLTGPIRVLLWDFEFGSQREYKSVLLYVGDCEKRGSGRLGATSPASRSVICCEKENADGGREAEQVLLEFGYTLHFCSSDCLFFDDSCGDECQL